MAKNQNTYYIKFDYTSANKQEFYKNIKRYEQKGYTVNICANNSKIHEYIAEVYVNFVITEDMEYYKLLLQLGIL